MEAVEENSKVSEEKFVFGPNAKFAGLDLAANHTGQVTIKPERGLKRYAISSNWSPRKKSNHCWDLYPHLKSGSLN